MALAPLRTESKGAMEVFGASAFVEVFIEMSRWHCRRDRDIKRSPCLSVLSLATSTRKLGTSIPASHAGCMEVRLTPDQGAFCAAGHPVWMTAPCRGRGGGNFVFVGRTGAEAG